MESILRNLQLLANALLISFMMFLFGRMLYALNHMRDAAKKTWQKFLTEFITALMGAIGIGTIIIIWTGV